MAVFFCYLVISDLSSIRYYTHVHWTSHVSQGTRKIWPCLTGHPVSDYLLVSSMYNKSMAVSDAFIYIYCLKPFNKPVQTIKTNQQTIRRRVKKISFSESPEKKERKKTLSS